MNKPVFNDTTDVNTAYKALTEMINAASGTDAFEIVYNGCIEVNKILDYLMERLKHAEVERFHV